MSRVTSSPSPATSSNRSSDLIGASVMLDLGDERIVLDFLARQVRAATPADEPRYVFAVARDLVESLVRSDRSERDARSRRRADCPRLPRPSGSGGDPGR